MRYSKEHRARSTTAFRRVAAGACVLLLMIGPFDLSASSRQSAPRADAFDSDVKPFLQTYCYGCHRGAQPAAGFDLTTYTTQESIVADQRRWNLVVARLRAGEMPP